MLKLLKLLRIISELSELSSIKIGEVQKIKSKCIAKVNLPGLASSDETKQTCQAPKLVVMWIFCICALSEQNAKATQIVQFSHIPYISQDID